jgi:hypothetical protein
MIIVIGLVAFLTGAVVGVIALLCVGISGEDTRKSLWDDHATGAAAATRRVVGWHGEPPRIVPVTDRSADRVGTQPVRRPPATMSYR